MQSHKTSTHKRGFSLIELLMVLGMLAVLGSFSLVVGMESYRGNSFEDEQSLLISALQKVRSQAMSGVCIGVGCMAGQSHGVHITPTQLVLFQGAHYNANDSANEYLPLENAAATFRGVSDVVFAEFSGDANPAGDIILSDAAGRVSTASVSSEGQITWGN